MKTTINSLNTFSEKAKEKFSGAQKIIGSVAVATALLTAPEVKAANNTEEIYVLEYEETYDKKPSRSENNEDQFIDSIPNSEPEVMRNLFSKYWKEFDKFNSEIVTLQKDNDHDINDEAIRDRKIAQSIVFADFMKEFFDTYGVVTLEAKEYEEIQKDAYFGEIPDGITFSDYAKSAYEASNKTLFDIE